jgi:hypothetical protein
MPSAHAEEIERLVRELHDINFFSLTFPGKPASPLDSLKTLQDRLSENISERYCVAIQVKIERYRNMAMTYTKGADS